MKLRTLLILIFLILLIGITVLINSIDTNKSRNKIIKNFSKNKELFEKVISELAEEDEDIYFEKKGNAILLSIHQHIDDEVNIIQVNKEEFYKYNQTIELAKLLNIKKVSKTNENIEFLFTDTFLDGGKCIVYIKDMEDYINNGHKIIEKKHILENWYYILNDAL